MAKSLRWSERALQEYKDLLDYINREWKSDIRDRVALEFETTFSRIESAP
jgi:plasmid stabilization system protein ParE